MSKKLENKTLENKTSENKILETKILEVRNLSVTFKTVKGTFAAVKNVNLDINEGELLGIVGESGSGKSVTMLAVMGLLPWTATISADKMEFMGQDLLKMSNKEKRKLAGSKMAMIFQEPMTSLNPCFTVGFQITEILQCHLGGRRSQYKQKAIELLESVGVPAAASRLSAFPHQFSGGMRQRVMIAMMLALEPKLLIADEPTTALDVTIQAQILDLLKDLQKNTGTSLVLITHDMGVIAEMAENVAVQYAGQTVEYSSVYDLFANPQHPYSKSLLEALPDRSKSGRLPTIPGNAPMITNMPTGCAFHPRCRYSDAKCASETPTVHNNILCHYSISELEQKHKNRV